MSEDTVPKKSDDSDLNIDFIKINIQIKKKKKKPFDKVLEIECLYDMIRSKTKIVILAEMQIYNNVRDASN